MPSRDLFQLMPHQGPRTLLGHRSPHLRGAVGASLLLHAAFILLLYVLMTMPAPKRHAADALPRSFAALVWLDRTGPSGGGGGGGNRSVEPPRKLETIGADQLAVPVLHAPPLTPPREIPPPQEPPPMALLLPVRALDAGQLPAAGVLENANRAPSNSQGPGTDNGAGTGRGPGSGPGNGAGLGPGSNGGEGNGPFGPNGPETSPVLLHEVKPSYTVDAMRARLQGEVWVAAMVLPDGSVADPRVVRSLDRMYGLDEEALRVVRQWRFKPGTHHGQPVKMAITIAVGFNMR